MNKQEFEMLCRGELTSYIQHCAEQANRSGKRVWEKSIPLWIAAFFAKHGVDPSLFSGNLGLKVEKLKSEHAGNPKAKDAIKLLKIADKQKDSAHSDFSIMTERATQEDAIPAVGLIEIKSLLGYRKTKFNVKQLFQDICVSLAYQQMLGEKGRAFALFLNVPPAGGQSLEREAVMEDLRKRFIEIQKQNEELALADKWQDSLLWVA